MRITDHYTKWPQRQRATSANKRTLRVSEKGGERPCAPSQKADLLVLIRPDHTVFYAGVSSAPFGRPALREVIAAIDRTVERPGAKWGDQ